MTAYRILVEGNVQGVGFRYYTRNQANSLGVAGWVKNQADGSVLIVAEGKTEQLEVFIAWCHEGPRNARVHNITIEETTPKGYKGFDIKF